MGKQIKKNNGQAYAGAARKTILGEREPRNGYWIVSADRGLVPVSVSQAVDAALDNFEACFGPVRDVTTQIGLEFVYDPKDRFKWFETGGERGLCLYGERRIYLSDRGVQVSTIHELAHLLDCEAGPETFITSGPLLDTFTKRSVYTFFKKKDPERDLLEKLISRMHCVQMNGIPPAFLMHQIDQCLPRDMDYITEQYARLIEKYAFLQLKLLDRSMVGVERPDYYSPKPVSDFADDAYYLEYGKIIRSTINARIRKLRDRFAANQQTALHLARIALSVQFDVNALLASCGDCVWWPDQAVVESALLAYA